MRALGHPGAFNELLRSSGRTRSAKAASAILAVGALIVVLLSIPLTYPLAAPPSAEERAGTASRNSAPVTTATPVVIKATTAVPLGDSEVRQTINSHVEQTLKPGERVSLPLEVTAADLVEASFTIKGGAKTGAGNGGALTVYSCDRIPEQREFTIVNSYFLSFETSCSGYYWLNFVASSVAGEYRLDVTIARHMRVSSR